MRKQLVALLLFLAIFMPSLQVRSELTAESLVESIELSAGNNTLNVSVESSVHLPLSHRNPQVSIIIEITSWTEANGTEHPSNITKAFSGSLGVNSFSFTDLRPDNAAISIHGYVVVSISEEEGEVQYEIEGEHYSSLWEDRGSYWLVSLYRGIPSTLIGVYSFGKANKTQEFELDFQNANLRLIGGATGLPHSWEPQEGCGTPVISKLGGFSVTYYALNSEGAASILSDVASQIRSDSGNLSWIESFEIKPPFDFDSLAKSKNKSVSELVPSDFTLGGLSNRVVIIEIPGGTISIGAAAVEYYGYIFVDGAASKEVILHEVAHAAGFCDPDPYSEWRSYWQGYLNAPISKWTNSTWYLNVSDTKFWVSLESAPMCPASKTTTLSFNVKSDPDSAQFTYRIAAREGTIQNGEGSATTPTTISVLYQAPATSQILSDEITFEITRDNKMQRFTFPYMVIPPQITVGNQTHDVYNQSEVSESGFTDDQLQSILDKIANLTAETSRDWDDPTALKYANRAEENLAKAKADIEQAKATNDTCVANLLRQAANNRVLAAQNYMAAAKKYNETWDLFGHKLTLEDIDKYAKIAEEYENKAQQLEFQATLGCPSSSRGISSLVALMGMFNMDGLSSGIVTLGWVLLGIGALLLLLGILGSFLGNKKLAKFLTAGIALLVIGILVIVFGGAVG